MFKNNEYQRGMTIPYIWCYYVIVIIYQVVILASNKTALIQAVLLLDGGYQ